MSQLRYHPLLTSMILGVRVWKHQRSGLGCSLLGQRCFPGRSGSARLGRDGCWCCCKPQGVPSQLLNSSARAVGIIHVLWSQCDNPSLAQGAELWFGSRG